VALQPLGFDPVREEAELAAYLGEGFERSRLERYQEQLDREFASCGDERRFYRTSEAYLYNLTAFAMTGTKLPYLSELMRHLPIGSRLLDYGCGIGSDGLLMLEAGYMVEFADFANPSTEYLRWRLSHRGLDAPVHDLDADVPGGFDGAYAFDVIEHVDEPVKFLEAMEERSRVVVVNLLEPVPDDQALHHELPIEDLVRRATGHRLLSYGIYHHRSHLVVYDTDRAGYIRRLRSRRRVARAQARQAPRHA
jgi:SAM-dependent methyltransferase